MKYIDRPEVTEVFADRLEHLFFDGATVRMEFTVTRTDPAQPNSGRPSSEPRQWSYTACRVVLSARGVAELLNKMLQMQETLVQQGVVQPLPQQPVPQQQSAQPQSPSAPPEPFP